MFVPFVNQSLLLQTCMESFILILSSSVLLRLSTQPLTSTRLSLEVAKEHCSCGTSELGGWGQVGGARDVLRTERSRKYKVLVSR